MLNVIRKYLALHQHIVLPGIGNFHVETNPSKIDFVNRCITSKENKIRFSNGAEQPENKFYNFLSAELQTDEVVAKDAFNNFTAQLQHELNMQQPVYLKGIGTLVKENTDSIAFEPEVMPVYFPGHTAEKIIRKNTAHTVRVGEDEKTSAEMHAVLQQSQTIKKERWWIAAAIIAVIGIAAIVFYYTAYT